MNGQNNREVNISWYNRIIHLRRSVSLDGFMVGGAKIWKSSQNYTIWY